jgi:hypothetical protein
MEGDGRHSRGKQGSLKATGVRAAESAFGETGAAQSPTALLLRDQFSLAKTFTDS